MRANCPFNFTADVRELRHQRHRVPSAGGEI
jgi:hypothetical protein